jgi:hypothetical protein
MPCEGGDDCRKLLFWRFALGDELEEERLLFCAWASSFATELPLPPPLATAHCGGLVYYVSPPSLLGVVGTAKSLSPLHFYYLTFCSLIKLF